MQKQSVLYQKETENANRRSRGRLVAVVVIVVVVLAAAAVLSYWQWGRPGVQARAAVRRGVIRGIVLAGGEVVSARQAVLSSRVTGPITTVSVEVGSDVVSGTLLLSIGAEALHFRVEDARLRVEAAALRLAQAQEGELPEEIAAAQADLDQALARLAALEEGPSDEDIAVARQEVVQAQAALAQAQTAAAVAVESARLSWETAANALRDAQDAYSRIYWENERLRRRGIELSQEQKDAEATAWRRVEDGEAAMEQARLAYERALEDQRAGGATAQAHLAQAQARLRALLSGPTEADLAQARAQVDRARANLALQQAGPRRSEVRLLEIDLHLAELHLQETLADLEKALVTAPFTGTVVEVRVKEGEFVGLYVPLIKLADLDQLQVEARVDEIDVGQVSPGQAVTITLDAFPGQPLQGYVEEVAPAVTVERGSAFYLATISFSAPPTLPVRLGMAANLTIVSVEKSDALLIPRRAVERVGAGYYVTVLRDGLEQRVRVTLGISDPEHYEVLSGLSEGEQVVLP